MRTRASQVAVMAVLLVGACDSPARVKPWRHAPDPLAEAANAPQSPALADISAESEVRAARGHTLRIHMDADPGRLNPLVAPTLWGRRITLGPVFESLVRYIPPDAAGASGRFAPRLARSWRVVIPPWGGLEIRLELEPNVTFHDGRPLTSSDVQFTLDAIRDPRLGGVEHLRSMLVEVDAVELITSTEVRLVLKRPSGWVLRALAEIPILPKHVYEGGLGVGGTPVGSGPWRVTSNKAGVVHLARYDKYWAGKAAIADLEFVYQPDAAIALKDAKRGDFDIMPALIPAHYPEQANAPGISAAFQPLELRPPRLRYLAFNSQRSPVDDVRVRHAIALLVDRTEISERYGSRLARPALWPIWPGGLVHGIEPVVPQFDPKAAGALLDAAGWIDSDHNGIRDRKGNELRVVMVGGERGPKASGPAGTATTLPREYLIEAARRIGMVIELRTGSEAWVANHVDDGKYDIVELQWAGMVDMDIGPRIASAERRTKAAPAGPVAVADSPVVRVLDQMATAWDPAERAKLAGPLASAFAETWPIAGIITDAPQGLVHRRVHGVRVWDGWIDLTQLSLAAN